MLDARITIIDGVMTSFDRKSKSIQFTDQRRYKKHLNFDVLVVCVGLVDKTLKDLGKALKEEKYSDTGKPLLTDRHLTVQPYVFYRRSILVQDILTGFERLGRPVATDHAQEAPTASARVRPVHPHAQLHIRSGAARH